MTTLPHAEKLAMTREEQSDFLKAVGGFVEERVQVAVAKATEPLKERIAVLEAERAGERLTALEAHGIIYRGIWQRAEDSYKRGDKVTYTGAEWIAVATPRLGDVPGKSANWQQSEKNVRHYAVA